MKAKKKPLEVLKPEALGVDVTPRLAKLKVAEPPKRKGGGRVAEVKELVTSFATRPRSSAKLSGRALRSNPADRSTFAMAVLVLAEHGKTPLRSSTAQDHLRVLGQTGKIVAPELPIPQFTAELG